MLNQLVESKSSRAENKTRGGYLFTTAVLIFGLFFSGILWSLFAKNLTLGEDGLDVSTLVAPIAENAPEPIKREQKIEQTNQAKSQTITRQVNMLRIDENPQIPKEISVVPNTQKARPNGNFQIAPDTLDGDGSSGGNTNGRETGGNDEVGLQMNQPLPEQAATKPLPPPEIKKPPVDVKPPQKPVTQSLGVVNGRAKFLPKPTYTAAAKAVRATGDVNVQVLIDEQGNVVSANAANGHPLLRAEAERAARNAKFAPTLLSKQPVKVSGVIIYKFSM